MRLYYKVTPTRSSEEDLSAVSSIESIENYEEDELFGSACSNESECEYCSNERKRCKRNQNTTAKSSTSSMTSYYMALDQTVIGSSTPLRNCTEKSRNAPPYHATGCCYRAETTPLLIASENRGYKSACSSNDTLGPADLSSKAVLATYQKLHKMKTDTPKKQSSIVTIFSLWNTTMGSSLLAMAWGVERAGLVPALILLVFMGGLCLYTAYLLLQVNKHHGGDTCEVPALCRALLGRWAETLAHCFSLLVLIGANIVYWILITNFLYFTVNYFMDLNTPSNTTSVDNTTLFCPSPMGVNMSVPTPVPDEHFFWRLHGTVPMFVALLMFPLLNFRNATFFTKFNSLGTLSVVYLLVFVVMKGWSWGVNYSASLIERHAGTEAAVLSGMLALSFYIHNIIITIMNSNERQENNGRDLTIAFCLVTLTYLLVGAGFYVCFPLLKTCIQDNILNNFEMHDVMTAVARILLLFQVITVYPLVAFMLRTEALLLLPLRETVKQAKLTTVLVNLVIVSICIIFACFCPSIGVIIRYTGAVSGLVHVFCLPAALRWRSLQRRGRMSLLAAIRLAAVAALGVANLLLQFTIQE